jgi:phosphonopyruvate decarboxylase
MIDVKYFIDRIREKKTNFFTGVPDSLLKNVCAYITDNTSDKEHIIAANEGNAAALAIGYHLATGEVPLVYMQNSGLGNIVNPILSLADKEVYSIPMILMIGWRGQPGIKDEPQHIKQGRVTESLLKSMEIPYSIISSSTNNSQALDMLNKAYASCESSKSPYALLVEKDSFSDYELTDNYSYENELTREDALKIIVDCLDKNDIVVSTTGVLSRELYEYRDYCDSGHGRDFLTVGGMGHANQIALGIAINKPERKVICLDGDGAMLMHMGSLALNASLKLQNYKHIIFNNKVHDSVGGQPIASTDINISNLADVLGYQSFNSVSCKKDIINEMEVLLNNNKCGLLEIVVNKGVRSDLSRPTSTPVENKIDFEQFLNE